MFSTYVNTTEAHQNIRLGVMCGHTGVNELHSSKPITFALVRELVRLRWNRDIVNKGTGRRGTEHKRTTEEAHEMILLGR